uniref:Fibronectin type-III domain-containing protein n=1 Tax=Candidatus Kentrum sp. FW TaxID=2126338 RepID=A0A450TTZ1_9GAMM|nr:MAG: hypothetical protein BECKFW1821C_GA0114237_103225 [Candidatus Kentron sp. FW]
MRICQQTDNTDGIIQRGKAAAYRIQRREGDSETWLDAGMAMDTEVTLSNQPRGVRLEFRVVAVNRAGEGEPSNGVLARL